MLILTESTDAIEIVLAGAVTTNQVRCVASWRDINDIAYLPGRTLAVSNDTTDVAIVGAPAAGDQRVVDLINVYNHDTVAATVTVKFDANGLVAAIAQDVNTRSVLMLAWMNAETLRMTLEEGRMVYWSRSRQEVWRKGDTSGDRQFVREAYFDCDGDTLLMKVIQRGPGACHEGYRSCFYRSMKEDGGLEITKPKVFDETEVYKSK